MVTNFDKRNSSAFWEIPLFSFFPRDEKIDVKLMSVH